MTDHHPTDLPSRIKITYPGYGACRARRRRLRLRPWTFKGGRYEQQVDRSIVGNSLLGPESNWKILDNLARTGVGIAFLHYALDSGDECSKYLLDWIGGYYKQRWSVNPSWLAQFKTLPEHPITRGVRPFRIEDEWYYHMQFRDEMKGVTPILTAIPPDSTRRGQDGPHSGNPTVRARMGMPEHVAWAGTRTGSTPRTTSAS